MSKYNFQVARLKQYLPTLRLTVSKTQIHINQETYEVLGKPKNCLLYYDKKALAIKLEPNSKEKYAMNVKTSRERYHSLSTILGKRGYMPLGVYELKDKKDFIFIKTEQSDDR